ncbi:MAG: methyltransferase domain-containing protein [Planctomycetota bacterium]|nr:methyltransferase domain-containing protein [Planctomycetota bacterium]
MSVEDRQRWDQKYDLARPAETLRADSWLVDSLHDTPPGRSLELACGLGDNSVWLATQGWQVDAVDVSARGLAVAAELASHHAVTPRLIAGDLDHFVPLPGVYDLVIVFRFLDRTHLPGLITRALAPGGLLIYETFGPGQCEREDNHLKNPAFVLAPGELPELFPELETVRYQETVLPDRSVGRFVGRRPGTIADPTGPSTTQTDAAPSPPGSSE